MLETPPPPGVTGGSSAQASADTIALGTIGLLFVGQGREAGGRVFVFVPLQGLSLLGLLGYWGLLGRFPVEGGCTGRK